MPAKVAPPLKSTSTRFSCSGEWVKASARTRVRNTSDLPEPVAPISRPCGPIPCWADSLMSRTTGRPSGVTAKGAAKRARPSRRTHCFSGSKSRMSPMPTSSMRSFWRDSSERPTGVSDSSSFSWVAKGVMRRATASACTALSRSAKADSGTESMVTTSTTSAPLRFGLGWMTRRRAVWDFIGVHSRARLMIVTPRTPAIDPKGEEVGNSAPSHTRRR